LVRSIGAVAFGVVLSSLIVIGTISAYDVLASCTRRQVCYMSQWHMYEHPVSEINFPLWEIAITASVVAFFGTRTVIPTGRTGPPLTAAIVAPALLIGGLYVYLFVKCFVLFGCGPIF
jgi:hypothetical protein